MNVLMLTKYGPLGASSRYRALQYIPYLESQGMQVAPVPLLDDAYIQRRYQGGASDKKRLGSAYLGRARDLVRGRSFDLVWIEKEAMPFVPSWIERLLIGRGTPYVLDYDDAVFHTYDLHPNRAVRTLLGGKLDRLMRGSALVVAGNDYLADRARRAGASRVEILPTVVDLDRYPTGATPRRDPGRPLTVGWIGSQTTGEYLGTVAEAVHEAATRFPIRMVAIGITERDFSEPDLPISYVPWSEATEVAALHDLDVGIMPLPDTPWTRGKCGLKLIQYMACGLPVAASPVGVNTDLVEEGGNGYLCATTDEWVNAFAALNTDAAYRARLGVAGRAKVEACYSLESAAPRFSSMLASVARS